MNENVALMFIDLFSVFKHKFERSKSYVYFCELRLATFTANYASYYLTAFLYTKDLGGK